MNCDYCGCLLPKEYTPNCRQCGAPRKYVVRDLPLREVTKGTKPPPKPLPPLLPLGGSGSAVDLGTSLLLAITFIGVIAYIFGLILLGTG